MFLSKVHQLKGLRTALIFSLTLLIPASALATSLDDSMTKTAGVDVDGLGYVSYDGTNFNPFSDLDSNLSSDFYTMGSFTVKANTVFRAEAELLAENAGAAKVNTLSYAYLNDDGSIDFGSAVEVLAGSDTPGSKGQIVIDGGDEGKEAVFFITNYRGTKLSTRQDDNSDKGDGNHLVTKQVQKGGFVTIPNATLAGDSYSFYLQHMAWILGWEDLTRKWTGERPDWGTKPFADWDHNDMLVQLYMVPEPSTLILLGAGLFGIASRRRKTA